MAFEEFVTVDTTEDIVNRFMILYDTIEELKELLNSFFTNAPNIRDMLEIESITSKKEMAKILVSYLGINFFRVTVGKSYNNTPSGKKSENGKYLIREQLLERICQRHGDPSAKKQEIMNELNIKFHKNYSNFSDLARDKFTSRKALSYVMKILQFPDTVFESPPKLNSEEETTQLGKKPALKPLYDYQTQAAIHIYEMLSEKTKSKRTLISVPTGAGKTRLTVEAIIDWINNRNLDKIPDAANQQKEGRIIFWFASTNELCSQAASEFVNIYTQLGNGVKPFNVTRLYGSKRRDLFMILEEYPGTHVIVTNTEHFQEFLKHKKSDATFLVDQYHTNELFVKIRKETIAIVIDEAHEVTADTYRKFLAAMGFDFSGRNKAKECNHNRNNIVLIGLTATPYRGSGIWDENSYPDKSESEFTEFDEENDPAYLKKLDLKTKMIHKMFNGVYIPLPKASHREPEPVPIIEAPPYAYINEHVKISGLKSFDAFSDISYEWIISKFGIRDTTSNDTIFYHKFQDSGTYNIKLTVTNKRGTQQSTMHQIKIYLEESIKFKKGNLEDNEEFNKILQDRGILCKIVYGVINGPQLMWDDKELQRWKIGNLSEENEMIIESDKQYNEHICDIVNKALKKHQRKKVLIFANGVAHAHNIALILKVRYNLNAQAVDGNMNTGLRRQVIHDFREGKIDVLCNHGILTSGFDVPDIDTLLICRTVGSNALYTQMIGRGQRGIIAGGTKDLWLITAYFKKGRFEGNIKLGWEALASSWENFPDDIKNDLNIQDNIKYDGTIGSNSVQDPVTASTSQRFTCKNCKIKAKDTSEARMIFGIEGTDEVVIKSIDAGTFPKYCITCRRIFEIADNTKSDFCKKITLHYDHDPVLMMVAAFSNETYDDVIPKKFSDLQDYLYKKFHGKINKEFFNIQNPSIQKAEELELLDINNKLDLKFAHISDTKSLKNILSRIAKSEYLQRRLTKLINDHGEARTISEPMADPLRDAFNELRTRLNHTPTSRQFLIFINEKRLSDVFAHHYRSDYHKFLWDHHIILTDDLDLQDYLYEEYFEKCLKENSEISRENLDEHGQYRISDYEEMFGTFEAFRKNTERDLKNLLDKHDELAADADGEFELIGEDLLMLRKRLNKSLHYNDIKVHSRIGSHRYLIQFKLSYLRCLDNYRGKHPGKFLRLVREYFRLKSVLKTAPTSEQFVRLTTANPTSYLGQLFDFNYPEFLSTINENAGQITPDHEKHMQEHIVTLLLRTCNESGKGEAFRIIDDAKDRYDDLSLSIRAWWPDQKKLKHVINSGHTSP